MAPLGVPSVFGTLLVVALIASVAPILVGLLRRALGGGGGRARGVATALVAAALLTQVSSGGPGAARQHPEVDDDQAGPAG